MRAQALLGGLLVLLLAPAAAQAASSMQIEPTIVVDAANPEPAESRSTLVAGRTYTVGVEGQYFETIPTSDGGTFTYTYDGVYCFEGSTSTSVCTRETPRLFEPGGLMARVGSAQSFGSFYRQLGAFTGAPPFHQGNRYFRDFTATTTGKLQLAIARDPRDSYRGMLRVTIWGPPSTDSKPPGLEPSPSLEEILNGACNGVGGNPLYRTSLAFAPRAAAAGPTFCPQLRAPSGWNRPSAIPVLDAGDEVIERGPALSATQRSATVTLSTSTGDVAVTLTEDDAEFRRFARRGCLLIASSSQVAEALQEELGADDSLLSADSFVGLTGVARYLLPCLKLVDDTLADRAASRASSDATARASASACRVLAFPVRVGADKDRSRVRVQTRRRDPLPDELRFTCARTSTGAIVIGVRPRRRGVSLRRVVGSRLSVGLVRPPGAKGFARGTITFRR